MKLERKTCCVAIKIAKKENIAITKTVYFKSRYLDAFILAHQSFSRYYPPQDDRVLSLVFPQQQRGKQHGKRGKVAFLFLHSSQKQRITIKMYFYSIRNSLFTKDFHYAGRKTTKQYH